MLRRMGRNARRRRMRQRNGRGRERLSRRQGRPQRRSETHRRYRSLFDGLHRRRLFNICDRGFDLWGGGPRKRLGLNGLRRGRTFFDAFAVARNFGRGAAAGLACHTLANLQGYVVIERAGVRLLVSNTQLCQRLKNHVGLYFELSGQLIDANFTHTMTVPGVLGYLIPGVRIFTKFRLLLFRNPVRRPGLPCSLSYQIQFLPLYDSMLPCSFRAQAARPFQPLFLIRLFPVWSDPRIVHNIRQPLSEYY